MSSTTALNSRHGTTCSISSKNMARRVFFVYFSKPVIIARVLCCLLVDVIWCPTYSMLLVEKEDLIRVSLDICATVPIHFVIADGVMAMEGNGPLNGTSRRRQNRDFR
jgi:hypothetical protein